MKIKPFSSSSSFLPNKEIGKNNVTKGKMLTFGTINSHLQRLHPNDFPRPSKERENGTGGHLQKPLAFVGVI